MAIPDNAAVVNLRRHGQFLDVSPPMECLTALRSARHRAGCLPAGYLAWVAPETTKISSTVDTRFGPARRVWAGLEPAVVRVLADTGCEIRSDGPTAELPAPDWTTLHSLQLNDLAMLETVRQHERSVIRYARSAGVDPALLIAQIAIAWPDHRIVVVAQRVDDVRMLRERLHGLIRGVVGLTGDDHPPYIGRVVVATLDYACNSDVHPWERDMLIVHDAKEFAGQRYWPLPHIYKKARLYGLLDVDAELAPSEADVLRCLFGFTEIVVPAHGCRLRPVIRLEHPSRGNIRLPLDTGLADLKRSGIWQNPVRNRKLARLAREIGKSGGSLAGPLGEPFAGRHPRVAVVVENLEHAAALRSFLPDWPLAAASNIWRRGLAFPGHLGQMTLKQGWPPLSRAIVTFEGLRESDISTIDVVVRADGGPGALPIELDRLTIPADSPENPLVLVDLADRAHPLLRKWVRSRRDAYHKRGWYRIGVDPVQERVQAFLNDRPPSHIRLVIPLTDDERARLASTFEKKS
jgi:hypothetical protein